MDKNDKMYQNLLNLLKCFKNRPYHLAKYLIDNKGLSQSLIKKLQTSEIKNVDMDIVFSDISELDDFFDSILNTKSEEEVMIEINKKLDKILLEENYEEAIQIRDYMTRNKIPRIYP